MFSISKNFLLIAILGLSPSLSCSTSQINAPRPELTRTLAEKIKPGLMSRQEVKNLLGSPDMIPSTEQLQGQLRGQEAWLYFAGEFQATRISVIFNADKVDSVSWSVKEGDLESDLTKALSSFPSAKFKMKPAPWLPGHHYGPDEDIYTDNKLGVEIVYLRTPKRVESISWGIPYRQLANEKK
jgi:hypothetical protein